MIEKDRGKRKGKVELVMHRTLFTLKSNGSILHINANYCDSGRPLIVCIGRRVVSCTDLVSPIFILWAIWLREQVHLDEW